MASLAWAELSPEVLAAITGATPREKLPRLCEALGIRHYADNTRSAVLVDFLFYVLGFCEEQKFSPAKSSALFSIMKAVFEFTFKPHDETQDVAFEAVTCEASFAFFKKKMLKHAVHAPEENSVSLFTVQDIEVAANFVSTTFYRHFKAYAYCFSAEQPLANSYRVITVETPLPPLPLQEATLDE